MFKYKLIEKIGSGQFGNVYKGINKITNETVAIKIEEKNKTNLLKNESNIYLLFLKEEGLPKLKWYGTTEKYNYMVLELLGVSLKEASLEEFNIRDIGKELINIIQKVHFQGIIHRDLKPDNILLTNKNKLNIIDFGFATSYIDSNTHIKQKENQSIIGSPEFISINIHNGINPSRRDDIESIIYILIFLCDPGWMLSSDTIDKIKQNKLNILISKYLKEMLDYCRNLTFDEMPNYELLIKMISY